MLARERGQAAFAVVAQLQPYDPVIGVVGDLVDQARRERATHQLDRAVMAQEEMRGDIADGWRQRRSVLAGLGAMAPDREQQLMLGGGEPDRSCLTLTPICLLYTSDAADE